MLRRSLCLLVVAMSVYAGAQVKVAQKGLFSYTGPAGFARNDSRVPKDHIGLFANSIKAYDYSPNIMIGGGTTSFKTATELGKNSLPVVKQDPEVVVLSTKSFPLGGADGFAIFSTRKLNTGLVLSQCQVIGVRKGQVVIFTTSTPKSLMEKHNAVFLASLKSFKWLN